MESVDPFWDAYDEEDRTVQRGVEAGDEHGQQLGWVEGWELGVKQGYTVGAEIGFFAGSIQKLKDMRQNDPDSLPEKVVSLMERLDSLIEKFPLHNTLDTDTQAHLLQMQELHKQIVSLLNVGTTFSPPMASVDF